MRLDRGWPLNSIGVVLLLWSCGDANDGSSGTGGTGGAGGGQEAQAVTATPGLWEGEVDGLRVCLFVDEDGRTLIQDDSCGVTDSAAVEGHSYSLEVDGIGRDNDGQSCGFALDYALDVVVDGRTGAFAASFTDLESGAELAFSGAFTGSRASGVAQSSRDGSACQVGWEATRAAPCDTAAIEACLDLQTCCEAILVNPVFFQSCNSVVLECNEARCLELLAGYAQCEQLDL